MLTGCMPGQPKDFPQEVLVRADPFEDTAVVVFISKWFASLFKAIFVVGVAERHTPWVSFWM